MIPIPRPGGQIDYVGVESLSSRQLVSYYLMASFLYYKHDVSLLADHEFDAICKRLLGFMPVDHEHSYLFNEEDLKAGSGYAIRLYPFKVQSAAWVLRRLTQP